MTRSKMREDFKYLRDHCIDLVHAYFTYNRLFTCQNAELLTKVAPTFFTDIAEIMHRDWLLQAYRIRPARDKRLAHFDRDHQVNGSVLGETKESELEQFLVNLQRYCDEVGIAIGIGPLDFGSGSCEGDVLDLLKYLREKPNA